MCKPSLFSLRPLPLLLLLPLLLAPLGCRQKSVSHELPTPPSTSPASPAVAPPRSVSAVTAPVAATPAASPLEVSPTMAPLPSPGLRGLSDAGPLLQRARAWLAPRLGTLSEGKPLSLRRVAGQTQGRVEKLRIQKEIVTLEVATEGMRWRRDLEGCRLIAGQAQAVCEREEAAMMAALTALTLSAGPVDGLRVEGLFAGEKGAPAWLQLASPAARLRWRLLVTDSGRIEELQTTAGDLMTQLIHMRQKGTWALKVGDKLVCQWRLKEEPSLAADPAERVFLKGTAHNMKQAKETLKSLSKLAGVVGGQIIPPTSLILQVKDGVTSIMALELPVLVSTHTTHPQLHRGPALSNQARASTIESDGIPKQIQEAGCLRAQLLGAPLDDPSGPAPGRQLAVVALRSCERED